MLEQPTAKVTGAERPFRHWVLDGLVSPAAVSAVAAAVAVARERQAAWVRYANDVERKLACRELAFSDGPAGRLFSELLSNGFTEDLQTCLRLAIRGLVADRTLHGGGIHVLEPKGLLGAHIDYALHPELSPPMERRLNLILYLTPRWEEAWGGATELYHDDGATVGARVYPAPGRALLWEPSDLSYHGTQRVAADCPEPRVTGAVYYVAPARPTCVRKRALFVPARG